MTTAAPEPVVRSPSPERLLRRIRTASPHAILAGGAALVLVLEGLRGSATLDTSAVWPVAQALVSGVSLLLAWGRRDELRLRPLLLLGLAFQLAWIGLHLRLGVAGDHDPLDVYPLQGDVLLNGEYPRSEYPPGAVALFALETWLGDGSARTANALLMVPFQLLCVAAIWGLRTQWTPWLAAFVALWPLNAFYWEFRFDLVPTAAVVAALLLARRDRWYESGFLLGLGTLVKWTPALSCAALFLWLLRTRRFEKGGAHLVGFAIPVLFVHLPLLLWRPSEVLAAYTTQNERTVTAESFVYLPLHLWWDAQPGYWYFGAADVSPDANRAALIFQLAAVAGLIALTALARTRPAAVALAGLVPAVFLLTNRIFSPQFYVLVLAAVVVAAALVLRRRSEVLAVVAACAVATAANTVLYQTLLGVQPVETVRGWMLVSALAFVPTILAATWLVARAVLQTDDTRATVRAAESETGVSVSDSRRHYREPPVPLPRWTLGVVRRLSLAVAALFAIAAVFAAVVMPYRFWDSLAFGSWSRTIAEGTWWTDVPAPYLQRPLFYVEQGLAWRVFGHEEWIGRLLSLSFAVVLVVAVYLLARRLASSGDAQAVLPPLAVLTVLASAVVATYAAAGMTDVPVAAMVAATGAAAWAERIGKRRLALVVLLAAATVLAKPTGLLALAGLAAALLVLAGRRSLRGLAALGAGAGLALLYAAWQAARIDDGILDFLTAGNDEFWRERGAAARWDALARAEWVGAGLRLLVLYALAHALARVAGARPRVALGVAAGVAIGWSVLGPIVADGGAPYPFDGSLPGMAAWLVLAAAMVAAPFAAGADPIARRTYAALLLWLAPMGIAWWAQRADDVRHLAPAWAPFVLLTAAALGALTLALVRLRPGAALAPAAAVALLALANLPSVDGLGRESWRELLDLGPSGWSDRAETENLAYGPFSYELNAARENVGEDERIVSSNGRLTYFFPGQVEVAYPTSCAELDGARFFSFLASGESLEFAAQAGQPTDPLAWLQCPQELTLVAEHEGIYAAYVVGGPPARAPAPEDCRIAPAPGQDVDAVFGDGLTYGAAKALRERAFAIGYSGGLNLERTGCSTFRVVVTGLPADDESVQTRFKRDAKKLGFAVTYAPGTRYPEVPPDVAAVP